MQEPSADNWWEAAEFRHRLPTKLKHASFVDFESLGGDSTVVDELIHWLNRGPEPWLYLHGPPGRGKSSLAVAVAAQLILRGRQPHFAIVTRLLDRARDQIGGERMTQFFAELAGLDVLLLDDLGRHTSTDWVVERIGLLLGRRYDNEATTIITTNLRLDELSQSIGLPVTQRIYELAKVVRLDGPNLRPSVIERRTKLAAETA